MRTDAASGRATPAGAIAGDIVGVGNWRSSHGLLRKRKPRCHAGGNGRTTPPHQRRSGQQSCTAVSQTIPRLAQLLVAPDELSGTGLPASRRRRKIGWPNGGAHAADSSTERPLLTARAPE
jgi:hypothetical protein